MNHLLELEYTKWVLSVLSIKKLMMYLPNVCGDP